MDSRHIVLKLFVEALGQAADIGNFENRKIFQKAVYLGQLSGIDLGYRYSWYLKGPYSTGLTRDYYQLSEAAELGDRSFENRSLNPAIREKLARLRPLFEVPQDFPRNQADWLELLASWHYLRSVSRQSEDDARLTMQTQKPELAPYALVAQRVLEQQQLLG
jgi:hypothetical protein